jgi:pimeloyl-ACP methyl ester carboxylesterase
MWLADRNYLEEGGTRAMSSILITGASNGIGRATAAELARRGHRGVATGAHAVRAKGTHIATRKVPASDSLTGPTKAWAFVTGASSGIGREFALALARARNAGASGRAQRRVAPHRHRTQTVGTGGPLSKAFRCGAHIPDTEIIRGANTMESSNHSRPVHYRTTAVGNVDVFYREAGPDSGPVVLLLHGFPSSSRMFRDLIPRLSHTYRVIAPDYPAFGHSAVPDRSAFGYTFDHLADVVEGLLEQLGIDEFAIYVMDFGAAVGFRLALRHPERLSALIVQNAPLYPWEPRGWWAALGQYWADGSPEHRHAARSYLDVEGLRGQYLSGVQDPSLIDPDNWVIDKALIDRPGVDEIMLDLLYDIRNQAPLFEAVQELLRDRRPPTLVATGANDEIFPEEVVRQILTDLPDAEYHALQTGHFALEDKAAEIAALMRDFLARTPVAAAAGRNGAEHE